MRLSRLIGGLLTATAAAMAAPASAQPSQAETFVLLTSYAERGYACGLLHSWEEATIRAETRRFLATATGPEVDTRALVNAAAARTAATPCDDPGMAAWIEGSRGGIGLEWLPPNLALFRALAAADELPAPALAVWTGGDLDAAVAAIDAQFALMTAAGARPEGSGDWQSYVVEVDEVARRMVADLAAGGGEYAPADAAAWIVEATIISGLWLEEQLP